MAVPVSLVGLLAIGGCRWQPAPGATWQWQLTGSIDTSVDADVFDVDVFDTPASVVADLHDDGRKVICYVNVGAWERWRPDAGAFPASVKGSAYDGWADERWLDVRRLDVLLPIIEARLDLCEAKGFDAVEPDNMDGYTHSTGFPLTYADQLAFNRAVAAAAHERGLAVGLKNDLGQVRDLVDDVDFAVNEECAAYDECHLLAPFIAQGKAVFHVEYDLAVGEFCPATTALGLSSIRKGWDLDAWRQACP